MIPARPPWFTAQARPAAGRVVVTLCGELDLSTIPALRACLAAAAAGNPARLELDLAGLTFTDCAGVRAIACAGSVLPPGCAVIIRSLTPPVRRMFELTGLARRCLTAPADSEQATGADAGSPADNAAG